MKNILILLTYLLPFSFLSCNAQIDSVAPCPRECSCAGQVIACKNIEASQIPKFPQYIGPFPGEPVLTLSIFNSPNLVSIQSHAFAHLLDLTSLHLHNNGLRNVSREAFNNLKRLVMLSLRNNEFTELPEDIFDSIPNLEELDLSKNKIKHLPISIERLKHLKNIRLNDLPLECACDLVDFSINLALIENSYALTVCDSPDLVKGKQLSMLGKMTKLALNSSRQLGYYKAGSDPEFFYRNLIGQWPWLHCPTGDIGGKMPIRLIRKSSTMKESAPDIVRSPESIYAVVGDMAEFHCDAIGYPEPQISWILPTNNIEYIKTLGRRRTLIVTEVHDYYEGTFTCVAKNELGSKMKSASLRIIPPSKPRIVASPPAEENSMMPGETMTLKCTARGRPRPIMSWIWEQISLPRKLSTAGPFIVRVEDPKFVNPSAPLPDASRISHDVGISHAYEEESSITLIIRNLTDRVTAGRYICYASNRVGTAQVSTVIRLKEPAKTVVEQSRNNENMANDTQIKNNEEETDAVKNVIDRARKRIEEAVKRTAERLRDPNKRRTAADIASLFRQPSRAALELAKAAEVYEVALEEVTNLLRDKEGGGLGVKSPDSELERDSGEIDEDLNTVNTLGVQLTTDQLAILSQLSGCQQSLTVDPCTHHLCFHMKYRSIDGRCNNLNNHKWGAALTPFYRLINPEYENGVNTPIGWNSDKSYFGFPKPSARIVSTSLLANATLRDTYRKNIMKMNEQMMKMKKDKLEEMKKNGMKNLTTVFEETTDEYERLANLRESGLHGSRPAPSSHINKIFNSPMASQTIDGNMFDEDNRLSGMLMQWGQFLDHDLDFTPVDASTSRFSDGLGCNETCLNDPPCFPILVPPGDPRIKHRCIGFSRSAATCGSGSTSFLTGRPHFREQINQITSFIDASNVYGSDENEANILRNLIYDEGKLLHGMITEAGKYLLPFNIRGQVDCQADPGQDFVPCFKAGDHRSNENLGLLSMHTLWLREHNRLAEGLRSINPHWSGDRIYQETRKIIGARMQIITYEEWLPKILGPEGMKLIGPYKGYNDEVNPSISNEFATAAFRFGHTLVSPIIFRLDSNWNPISQGHLELHKAFFAPDRLLKDGGMDPVIRGLLYHGVRKETRRPPLTTELTEKLFSMAHELALDLAALNVQRGRDHGIPSYTSYAHLCQNLPSKYPNSFDDLSHLISNSMLREKMRQVYGHPGNVDLFVGAILEDLLPKARVGPTFACIIADQFKRLRDGDRFWYEADGIFTIPQKSELKRAGGFLSRVICDNSDNITEVPKDAFIRPMGGKKSFVMCDSMKLPILNLAYWKFCPNADMSGDDNYSFQSRYADENAIPSQTANIRQRRSVPDIESSCSNSERNKENISELSQRIYMLENDFRKITEKLKIN